MKKVLILGVASVQADAIKLLKEYGYEVYACAKDNIGEGIKFVDEFRVIDILDREKLAKYILEKKIDIVYSVGSDLAMPVVGYLNKKLGLKGFISEEVANICNNKNLMREKLGKNFIGNVKSQVLSDSNETLEVDYPFIMKPTDSQGQRGVKLIKSKKEFLESFNVCKNYSRSGLVIIEEYIDGPEISVNGYIVDGNLKYITISDRETWKEYTGLIHKHIVPSNFISGEIENEIKRIVEEASSLIGIDNGPIYLQMKINKNGAYIIEITPRLDGCHMWRLLKEHSGINLLKLTFEHLLNSDVSELDNIDLNENKSEKILEFICQKPNTLARYDEKNIKKDIIEKRYYYQEGELIKPVNGIYDKIGYIIY